MDRIGAEGTNTEYCLEGVGSRTQMGNGTKVFHGVAFFLQRVIRCGNALYGNFCRLNLKRLFCPRGSNEGTFYDDAAPTFILEISAKFSISSWYTICRVSK